MNHPEAARQQLLVFECLCWLEIHLRGISFGYLQLAIKCPLARAGFTRMVPICHDDIVDRTVTANESLILSCHGGRIDQNLMVAHDEKQPVEVELFLLREPGPLPETWKDLFHVNSSCPWSDSQNGQPARPQGCEGAEPYLTSTLRVPSR